MRLTVLFISLFVSTLSTAQNIEVEAENYCKQTNDEVRKWYLTNLGDDTKLQDPDPNHAATASGGAYIEILPDTRVTHDDKLTKGVNFAGQAGDMAVVHYKVNIPKTGKYYVWVKAFSTGSEDNGVHVGIDNKWPESGKRMQWCEGKRQWTWASKQRTKEVHCGEPYLIFLDIDKVGQHEIMFSMREDGFEFDKFLLTQDMDFVPTH